MMKLNRFAGYAWGVVAYTLFVILWGAFVRATGSGAGCGSHWPSCNGQVIPRPEALETMIEFTHRVTSGLAGVLVIILVVWAFRAYPKGHRVRAGAVWSLIFVIIEGLVGAGLVLFELVGDNASVARAYVIAAHLVNTLILLAIMTVTAWWASGGRPIRWRGQGQTGWLLAGGLLAMAVVGATGAITALGDTLFLSGVLTDEARPGGTLSSHFLIRLRIIHPFIAMLTGLYVAYLGSVFRAATYPATTRRLAGWLIGLFFGQLAIGAINVALKAPVWMQLLHLLLADLVWIVLVLLAATVLAGAREPAAEAPQQQAAPG